MGEIRESFLLFYLSLGDTSWSYIEYIPQNVHCRGHEVEGVEAVLQFETMWSIRNHLSHYEPLDMRGSR